MLLGATSGGRRPACSVLVVRESWWRIPRKRAHRHRTAPHRTAPYTVYTVQSRSREAGRCSYRLPGRLHSLGISWPNRALLYYSSFNCRYIHNQTLLYRKSCHPRRGIATFEVYNWLTIKFHYSLIYFAIAYLYSVHVSWALSPPVLRVKCLRQIFCTQWSR